MTHTRELKRTTTEGLRDLVRANIDSAKRLSDAAGQLSDDDLSDLLRSVARVRKENASQLQAILRLFGEEPVDTGSLQAKLRGWWVEVRSSLTSWDVHAVLAVVARGEDTTVRRYVTALSRMEEAEIEAVVRAQLDRICRFQDRVRVLRRECEARN